MSTPANAVASAEKRPGERKSRAGVGFSENASSRQAGIEAARQAMERAGTDRCSLALLFATSKHDPAALRDGVREVIGPHARIAGGAAVGIITNDRLGYEGHQVGVAVVESDTIRVDLFKASGLPDNERDVGRELGTKIRSASYEGDPNVLLVYDIVKQRMSEGMSLNMATPLLAGMEDALEGQWPATAGGGLLGDMQGNPTFQFLDDDIAQQTALALVFHGGIRMDTTVMHGCKPSGGYHTITKTDGNVVLEVDGRPTADLVTELMGHGADSSMWDEHPHLITLGINNGDKFGEYREDDYAVRLCMDVDRERRGLVFFGDDLVPGTEVQLMRRSISFDYVEERTERLLRGAANRKPLFAFYIDCAGRAATYAGTEREEAEEVQRAIGDQVPLLGWYVGCEIARAGERMQSYNYTGVLCIFSEEATA